MANYEIAENLGYEEEIRKLEPSDPAHADLFNSIFERIIRNVAFLKRNSVSHEELGIPEGESPSVENQVPAIPESPVKRENIADGDNMGTILAKVRKWLGDLKNVAFTGSYNDLSDKPSIPTVPGAIKNPHTLSVNGKSYDGAVAVEVGTIGIAYGGTGATTAASARTALGLGTASTQGTANNLTTTAAGYALDARQGKVLKDEIGQISSDLGGLRFGTDANGNYGFIKDGADTVTPFRGRPLIFSTSPADIKSILPATYKNLTVDDFLICATGADISLGISKTMTAANYYDSIKCSKAYDPATGKLTFSGFSCKSNIPNGWWNTVATGVIAIYTG